MEETSVHPAVDMRTGSARAAHLRSLADWLGLAAAPTFAIMALFTGLDNSAPTALCGVHGASPLAGMALMYWLMSAFHAAAWLKLISIRDRAASK